MSKKISKAAKEAHQFAAGDCVLGKIRGYPPWPGIVVDPSDAPPAVQEDAPMKKNNIHCVMFFPAGEYGWIHVKDLNSLKRHEIEAYLADESKKRNGDLREGYSIALNPKKWIDQRMEDVRAAQDAVENEQVDQLESEGDGDGDEDGVSISKKAKASKKRKRDSEAAETTKATKKTPKAKKDSAEPVKKKAASIPGKPKRKSKATVESEDEGGAAGAEEEDENAGPSKKASPPPAKKAKREKDEDGDDNKPGDPQSMKVRDWRHKLQKTFLSNKPMPKAESITEIDQLFTTVETYDEMTIEQLQFSKIGKVMRHIAALSDDKMPPRDDEFHFRARAKGLVDKWHQILNANKPPAAVGGGATESPSVAPAAAPAQANGNAEKVEGGAEAENGEADAEADAEMAQGTKNLDINGKVDAPEDQDAPAEADTSLADVTMAEA